MKTTRIHPAPKWKVGDIVYFKWDSGFYWSEKEIVGETSRSWLVINKDASPYQKDPTHWRWPEYCEKLPKCGYEIDKYKSVDHWQFGTKQSMVLTQWANKHRVAIANALLRGKTQSMDHYRLLNLAKDLGLTEIVAEYPEEVVDVKAETSQSPAVEVTDGNRSTTAPVSN